MRHFLLLTLALICTGCPAQPSQTYIIQHATWTSDADPTSRPWSTREGKSVTLHPSGATYKVPNDWLEWHQKFGNNFHLTHAQLDAVARGAGEWDTEYASVCNATLPFDRCAAHVGDEGWGKQGVSYGDLQVRVYDLAESLEVIERAIEDKGAADVARFAGRLPKIGWCPHKVASLIPRETRQFISSIAGE
jgi:hypothetical protein